MHENEAAHQEVKALLAEVDQVAEAGDIDRFMTMVHEDCQILGPDMPPLIGKDAIREVYGKLFADFDWVDKHIPIETEVVGDLIFHRGTAVGSLTPVGEGEVEHFNNKYLQVLRRGADGKLKFWKAVFNSNPPEPET